jgi:DNA-binding NarL/FixJ family response regulator
MQRIRGLIVVSGGMPMPGPKPYALTLSDRQQVVLQSLVRRQTRPQRLVSRAKVILAAAGQSNEHIAQQLGLTR